MRRRGVALLGLVLGLGLLALIGPGSPTPRPERAIRAAPNPRRPPAPAPAVAKPRPAPLLAPAPEEEVDTGAPQVPPETLVQLAEEHFVAGVPRCTTRRTQSNYWHSFAIYGSVVVLSLLAAQTGLLPLPAELRVAPLQGHPLHQHRSRKCGRCKTSQPRQRSLQPLPRRLRRRQRRLVLLPPAPMLGRI